jgi:hypothetical protein
LSRSLRASQPPAMVLKNAAPPMITSNTIDSFHAFGAAGYIVPTKLIVWGTRGLRLVS